MMSILLAFGIASCIASLAFTIALGIVARRADERVDGMLGKRYGADLAPAVARSGGGVGERRAS